MSSAVWFQEADIKISAENLAEFEQLYTLFVQWNSQINLSAIRDEAGIWQKHFIDSALGNDYFNFRGKILDLGTGGGFPCLPLSILNKKSVQFLALDSVAKKLKAVQAMANELALPVKTLHGRAEDLAHDKNFREKFDFVVTRAVAPWPVLLELALPFVKVGGSFVAYQGPAIHDDLSMNKKVEQLLGAKIVETFETKLFDQERVFVEVKKIKPTPQMYPREVGVPRKKPLA